MKSTLIGSQLQCPVRLFVPSYYPFFLLLALSFHFSLSGPCLLLILALSFLLHSLSIRATKLQTYITTLISGYATHLAVSLDFNSYPFLPFISMFPTPALTIPVTFDLTQIVDIIHTFYSRISLVYTNSHRTL
jgi:hypothetical protein